MNTLKALFRLLSVAVMLQMAWVAAALIPASWLWLDVEDYIFTDGTAERPPTLTIDRTIKRHAVIRYSVRVVRGSDGEVICTASPAAFPYDPAAKNPSGKDFLWWVDGDPDCWPLPPGQYMARTCWTVLRPFWGLVPPKVICRRSNVFTIASVSPEEAEQAIQQQRVIEGEVQGLKESLQKLNRN